MTIIEIKVAFLAMYFKFNQWNNILMFSWQRNVVVGLQIYNISIYKSRIMINRVY